MIKAKLCHAIQGLTPLKALNHAAQSQKCLNLWEMCQIANNSGGQCTGFHCLSKNTDSAGHILLQ